MTDETFHKKLTEIRQQIDALPDSQRGPLLALLDETKDRNHQLKECFARTREALDDWRVSMKYLLFDCEAARRERDELRKRLEDS